MATMLERVYEYFIFEDIEITKLVCAPLEVWNLKGTKLGISKQAACSDVEADFNVKVGKKNIRIHKVCLRKISPVFDAMMIADESKDTFHFDDFDFSTVRNALRFMFNEDVTEFLTTDQVYDIIRFAKKYEFYDYEKIIIYCANKFHILRIATALRRSRACQNSKSWMRLSNPTSLNNVASKSVNTQKKKKKLPNFTELFIMSS